MTSVVKKITWQINIIHPKDPQYKRHTAREISAQAPEILSTSDLRGGFGSEKPHIRPRVAKKPSSLCLAWADSGWLGERASGWVSATFSLRLFHQTSIFDSPRSAEEGSSMKDIHFTPSILTAFTDEIQQWHSTIIKFYQEVARTQSSH